MAIKSKLSILMGKHRMSIQDVCNNTGLSRNTIAFLYHDKQHAVHFETLDKLCGLFDCNVQDIIEYSKGDDEK